MLERGFEGVSIVSQTTNNRKGAIPKLLCLKKTKNAQEESRFKEVCSPQKANVTWHIIEAFTSTLREEFIVDPRTAVRGPSPTPQRKVPGNKGLNN